MPIRRRPISGRARQQPHTPLQSCLDTEQALRQGREAVGHIFEHASQNVGEEILHARAIFSRAEGLLTTDSRKVHEVMAKCKTVTELAYGKAAAAAQQGEAEATNTMRAMMERLNKISESLTAASQPAERSQGE